MSNNDIHVNFEITTHAGALFKPSTLQLLPYSETTEQPAFDYLDDVLLGLSAESLIQHFIKTPHLKNTAATWKTLETSHHFFNNSQARILGLKKKLKHPHEGRCHKFEKSLHEIVQSHIHTHSLHVEGWLELIDLIQNFETQLGEPLLYNFKIDFSEDTKLYLQYVYSLLFHLRALAAIDYNSSINDPSYEAVKLDSVTDYLAKAEYVVNDALLYHFTHKLGALYTEGDKASFKEQFYQPMTKLFDQYCYNGKHLVESLPSHFISSQTPAQAEETLYLVQMDWLLGSESGLLFKIREELFGVRDGYETIFWPEVNPKRPVRSGTLEVHSVLSADRMKILLPLAA